MINIEVKKNNAENSASIIKRFTRRVQGSGILPKKRSLRYAVRQESPYTKKKKTLKKIRRKTEVLNLIKMGKMKEKTRYR